MFSFLPPIPACLTTRTWPLLSLIVSLRTRDQVEVSPCHPLSFPSFLLSFSGVLRCIPGTPQPPECWDYRHAPSHLALFFWWDWGLNSGLHVWLHVYKVGTLQLEPHLQSSFCSGYFGGRSCELFGWPGLLISASRVARITDMSHQCPDFSFLSEASSH
jgi:hypothetical protein